MEIPPSTRWALIALQLSASLDTSPASTTTMPQCFVEPTGLITTRYLNVVEAQTCSCTSNILSHHLMRPFAHKAVINQVTSGFTNKTHWLLHTRCLVVAFISTTHTIRTCVVHMCRDLCDNRRRLLFLHEGKFLLALRSVLSFPRQLTPSLLRLCLLMLLLLKTYLLWSKPLI
jgi:hypothetical protein